MNGIVDINNHIALTSAEDIDAICRPLKKLGITYFSYVRTYKDGRHIRLSNNPEWTAHYYERQFYNVIVHQVPKDLPYLLWSSIDPYPLFYEASEFYNIDNGVVIVNNVNDHVERYFFGSTRENKKMNTFYCHHMDLLHQFIFHFKDKAEPLIKKANQQKILIPSEHIKTTLRHTKKLNQCIDELSVTRYCLTVDECDIYLTQREAEILFLLKQGYTAKTIAEKTGLSCRTVETYKNNLKKRCEGKEETLARTATNNKLLNKKILLPEDW